VNRSFKIIFTFVRNQIKLVKDLSESYDSIVIQNEMDPLEFDGLAEFSRDLHNELIDEMTLNFNYNFEGLSKTEKKKETKAINTKAKSLPLFINDQFDRATLVVDLEKGISPTPRFEEGSEFKGRAYGKLKGKATQNLNNIKAIKKVFAVEEIQEGKEAKSIVEFPQNIALNVDGELRYFQLVRYAGPEYGQIGEGISQPIARGTFAQYIEVDVMGSSAQTPIGFIFGNRDTNKKVKETVSEANPTEGDGSGLNAMQIQEEVDYEYGTLPSLDRKIDEEYNNWIGKDKFPLEFYLTTDFMLKFIKGQIDALDGDVTFENGKVITEAPSTEQPEQSSEVAINNKKWTKDSPKENPNTAYVFTENINSIGDTRVGGGSAVIRNNPNAIGIVTKKYYFYSENRNTPEALEIKEEYKGKGEWYNQNFQDTDVDFELFKKVNLEQFTKLDKFDSKIFPDSFANSLASVPNRFALWLQNELQTRYGLVTEVNSKGTGLISKSVQSASNEVNFEEKDVTSTFSVKPEKNNVTSTFSLGSASESTENADEGIGNSASEKLEEFYNSLSLPQKLSLQQQKIANLADLEKESKKDFYKDVDDFIDQLKKCF